MNSLNKENSFLSKRSISSISEYKNCLKRYSENFDNEVTLKTETPIFLDTNILLRYYSISFAAREKLFGFVKSNAVRIFLSSQVQSEFIRNREDVIQRFFEQVTNKIPKDFNADVVNKMNAFLEQHKTVLKDYPFVEAGFKKHKEELEKLLIKLNETIKLKKKEHNDLITQDHFLDLLSTCNLYEELTKDEQDQVKKDFDILSKGISSENIDSVLNKPDTAFPGLGDIKNKPDDPYGDYIIFHEMMRFMLYNKTDVIFLTFDNSKGDWMHKSKFPYLHYVQNMYVNTGQILYIIDAEKSLGELLNVNIESLVANKEDELYESITIESLQKLIDTCNVFAGIKKGICNLHVVEELTLNGYKTIKEVENDIWRSSLAVKEYLKAFPNRNTVGALRACIRIANPKATATIGSSGLQVIDLENYKFYRQYLIN
jgi:hypothetical protein